MTYDPTDVRRIEREKEEAKASKRNEQKAEEDDLKWLMGQKRGRTIMWRLLSESKVFQSTFNTNAMQMAFGEGNRSYGNKVLGQIMALVPDQFIKMQQEATNDRNDGSDSNPN